MKQLKLKRFNILVNNLIEEAKCKPDTMLNQADLNAKKIPQERKAKVVVKQDGNTTGITYNVDSDTSAEYMVDNIKANGGSAKIIKGSGITKETIENNFAYATDDIDVKKYMQFLKEGKLLGIDAVTNYLNEHSAELSDDFYFNLSSEEQYFEEYAIIKYNNSLN